MRKEYPSAQKKRPIYSRWWFLVILLLGVLYAASIFAVPVIDRMMHEKFNPPVTIMYKWTDENGIAHYSDKKPNVTAEVVPYVANTPEPSTLDRIGMETVKIARKNQPLLAKLLIAFVAAVVLVLLLKGAFTGIKRTTTLLREKSFMAALGSCIKKAEEFGSGLIAADIDKVRYIALLGEIRTALERIEERPLAKDYNYDRIVESLQQALESYEDCLTLWDVESHKELTEPNKQHLLGKFPTLIDRTVGIGRPLSPEELQKAVRSTIWDYASRYVIQAERLYAQASDSGENSEQ